MAILRVVQLCMLETSESWRGRFPSTPLGLQLQLPVRRVFDVRELRGLCNTAPPSRPSTMLGGSNTIASYLQASAAGVPTESMAALRTFLSSVHHISALCFAICPPPRAKQRKRTSGTALKRRLHASWRMLAGALWCSILTIAVSLTNVLLPEDRMTVRDAFSTSAQEERALDQVLVPGRGESPGPW